MIERFYVDGVHSRLSNFSFSLIVIDGKEYPSVEHYYQCMKTLDADRREAIRRASNPGLAKKMGRRVQLRATWEEIKIPVMRRGLLHKFPAPAVLGYSLDPNTQYLMDTGDQYLVEGNDWNDTFWGVCRGQGENWLGHLLMARRAEVRAT